MAKFKKYFTPVDANKRLPYVKKVVADLLEKGRQCQHIMNQGDYEKPPEKVLALEAEIEELMMELEEIGCFYKDWNFEIGLVDFPAKLNGEEILLCWRSDEDDVRWYHPVMGGYAERQQIPEPLLKSL